MSAAAEDTPKRGPGRPPKNSNLPRLEKKGVVATPHDENNRMECVFDDPGMFKSLFAFLKTLKATTVHMLCTKDHITLFTRDPSATTRIVARLNGKDMNSYYCRETFWLGFNRESVDPIFETIDKSFHKITILQPASDKETIQIILKDATLNKERHHDIRTVIPDEDKELRNSKAAPSAADMEEFRIEFRLPPAALKKSFADAQKVGENLTIEQNGPEGPLQFTYAQTHGNHQEVYRDHATVGLKSRVPADECFSCRVALSRVKQIPSAAVALKAPEIHVLCQEEGDVLFSATSGPLVLATFVATT